jgi:outer membrane protein TolC
MALQHNLDIQAEAWEGFAWDAARKASFVRVFPRLVGSGEWTDHGKGLVAYAGADPDGGPGVVEGFPGRGRTSLSYFGEIRWSPNDAALAYLASTVGANERAKAGLTRARAVQKTLGAVEAAFYRLLSLDQCLPLVRKLVELRAAIAQRSRDLRQKRLADPDEAGRAEQKAAAARLLETRVSSEIERQRTLLALHLGVSPQSPLGRSICVTGPIPQPLPEALSKLVAQDPASARPDVRAEALNVANARAEAAKNTVKLLPKVTGYVRESSERRGRRRHSADKRDAGILLYLDATEWFAGLQERNAAEARRERAAIRFRAVSIHAEAEASLAYMKCVEGLKDLQTMELAVTRSRELVASARERAKAGEIEPAAVDEAQANALQDDVERIRMLGEVNARFAELGAAAGADYSAAVDCVPHCESPRASQ